MDRKPLPIGIDSFRELRETGCYYSDKSMMVAEFLQSGAKVTLITRPRRFGKTLNMDMVKEFLDIEVHSEKIFQGLNILDSEYRDKINTKPVIFFSFRDCKGDYPTIIKLIKDELYREYRRFEYIGSALSGLDKEDFHRMISSLRDHSDNVIAINRAIAFLCETVSKYYGIHPCVLIDEYDTPMISAYSEGCYEKLRAFFTALYGSALKGNPYLDKALLTGVQRIAKENIFSGLNNLLICTVNDEPYSSFFGFDEKETSSLLQTYGLYLNDNVKRMYDGYRFGGKEVYNPWSIINYANSSKLIPFWVNTSSNALIRSCVLNADEDFLVHFDELITAGSTKVSANFQTSFFEISSNDTLWGMLLNAGYITTIRELNLLTSFYEIRIPNLEVSSEFQSIVAQRIKTGESLLKEMIYYLIQEHNIPAFTQIYRRIIMNVTSYFDAKENAYHMLMLGMCIFLSGEYEITSNLESGLGRSDLVLKAKHAGMPHIIIEFKQGKNLQPLADDALHQMIEKQYYSGLSGEILLMGIAHYKKQCEIKTSIIHNPA